MESPFKRRKLSPSRSIPGDAFGTSFKPRSHDVQQEPSFTSPTKASLSRFDPDLIPQDLLAHKTRPPIARTRGVTVLASPPRPTHDEEEEASSRLELEGLLSSSPGQEEVIIPRRSSDAIVQTPDAETLKRQELLDQLLAQRKRLQNDVGTLQKEVQRAQGILGESGSQEDVDTLLSIITSEIPSRESDPSSPKVQPLIARLATFLPFSKPPTPPKAPPASSKLPLPSHLPVELEDPLPHLRAFTALEVSSTENVIPSSITDVAILHEHSIRLSSPDRLLCIRLNLVVNTTDESVHHLSVTHVSPWAGAELGNWICEQAQSGDITSIGWASNRYWDVACIRACTWAHCAKVHEDLLPVTNTVPDAMGSRESFPQPKGAARQRQPSPVDPNSSEEEPSDRRPARSILHSHLGRQAMLFSRNGISVLVTWRIGFDWTGEVESEVSTTAAFPASWKALDERQSLDGVPKLFDRLVADKGVREADAVVAITTSDTTASQCVVSSSDCGHQNEGRPLTSHTSASSSSRKPPLTVCIFFLKTPLIVCLVQAMASHTINRMQPVLRLLKASELSRRCLQRSVRREPLSYLLSKCSILDVLPPKLSVPCFFQHDLGLSINGISHKLAQVQSCRFTDSGKPDHVLDTKAQPVEGAQPVKNTQPTQKTQSTDKTPLKKTQPVQKTEKAQPDEKTQPANNAQPIGEDKSSKQKDNKKKPPRDYLDEFFARYPSFNYNRNARSKQEFHRMCKAFGWDRGNPEREIACKLFKTALVKQFNSIYGTNVDDPEAWRKLCQALDIEPLPKGLEASRKVVVDMFVNLVDFVDTPRTGEAIRRFGGLDELRGYTIANERYFPKDSAYAGGVLVYLLREIHSKYMGERGKKA